MGDPLELFGEVYGTAESRRRFIEPDFGCPFDSGLKECNKIMRRVGLPRRSGNCSLKDNDGRHIICPHRFYEDNYRVLREVRDFVWGEDVPACVYKEMKLTAKVPRASFGFGSLDWIMTKQGTETDFIGIEIQSNATTGTGGVGQAIKDLLAGTPKDRYGVGANSLDAVKRFMTQFIFKGQLFDDWKMPYVVVIQDRLWDEMSKKFRIRTRTVDRYDGEIFLFFIYDLAQDGGHYTLRRTSVKSSRWIDFLFAYAVDANMLLSRADSRRLIESKAKELPALTF